VVALAMLMLLQGASESATVNTIMVLLKIGVLVFFCVIAFTAFKASNLKPFAPMGWAGIQAAGSKVFFSYIGFDAASTAGEEAKNPKRDLPLAIIGSLVIVTVVYVAVGLAAVGAMPWNDFKQGETEASLSLVLERAVNLSWPSAVLSLGAVIAIASVVLSVMYGQTRILFAMSRDGLMPKVFQKVSANRRVPVANTLIVSAFIALLAAVVPLGHLADATSIGTLFAFGLVNIGVMVLRRTRPDLPRSFRTPVYPVTPMLGVLFCAGLIFTLDRVTQEIFLIWMAVGLVVYFLYSRRHSRLGRTTDGAAQPPNPKGTP
jgi:APA family basic amino acid/polyamine antiporter